MWVGPDMRSRIIGTVFSAKNDLKAPGNNFEITLNVLPSFAVPYQLFSPFQDKSAALSQISAFGASSKK
jgi:hypothetical protein